MPGTAWRFSFIAPSRLFNSLDEALSFRVGAAQRLGSKDDLRVNGRGLPFLLTQRSVC